MVVTASMRRGPKLRKPRLRTVRTVRTARTARTARKLGSPKRLLNNARFPCPYHGILKDARRHGFWKKALPTLLTTSVKELGPMKGQNPGHDGYKSTPAFIPSDERGRSPTSSGLASSTLCRYRVPAAHKRDPEPTGE